MFEPKAIDLIIDEKKITGLTAGIGSVPALIVGPASFYLNKLSDNFKRQFTLFAFDELWSCKEEEPIDAVAVNNENLLSLIIKVESHVNALKKAFNYDKVGLIGFSVPGLIAAAAALKIGSAHIAFVIGSGLGSDVMDKEFKGANHYFEKYADNERKARFIKDNEKFNELKKQNLNSLQQWQEAVHCIGTKQLYDYKEETVGKLVADWSYTPDGKVMCEPMRTHFFEHILMEISPPELMEKLVKTAIPFMLVYGKRDFTTPPPKKKEREKWKEHSNFFFKKYEKSVHYPSWEYAAQFDDDIANFLQAYQLNTSLEAGLEQQIRPYSNL